MLCLYRAVLISGISVTVIAAAGCESRSKAPERTVGITSYQPVVAEEPGEHEPQADHSAAPGSTLSSSAAAADPATPDGGSGCRPGMVRIDGGASTRNGRRFVVATFCLDVTEVTVVAYEDCVKGGACRPAGMEVYATWYDAPGNRARAEEEKKAWSSKCNAGQLDRSNHPVNCVDWGQANEYCKAYGKRLPTDEEWEWAARGREGRAFPWGDAKPELQLCGSVATRRESTCPVGKFRDGATPEGVLDMAGNVDEWTVQQENPSSVEPMHVTRGGNWFNTEIRSFAIGRGIDREVVSPRARRSGIGFRCAANSK